MADDIGIQQEMLIEPTHKKLDRRWSCGKGCGRLSESGTAL